MMKNVGKSLYELVIAKHLGVPKSFVETGRRRIQVDESTAMEEDPGRQYVYGKEGVMAIFDGREYWISLESWNRYMREEGQLVK